MVNINKILKKIKEKERDKHKYQEKILDYDKKIIELYKEKNKLVEKVLRLDEDIYQLNLQVDKEQIQD
ncbi:MAG: hypothetical protein ACTSQY_01645 [Candidatus Odinarchaeia archaeon]